MDTLKLSDLVGQEIRDLRFHYISENEYGLQSFYSYIKLANEIIIDIPEFSDDNDFMQLTQDNQSYLRSRFDTGEVVSDKIKTYFVGQKIVDFYFSYYNDEVDINNSAFIKLTNGYFPSENNSGPIGVTNVDFVILDEKDFTKEVERLNEFDVVVRSFIQTKNAC